MQFQAIIDMENPDLFKWLTGQTPVPEEVRARATSPLRAPFAHARLAWSRTGGQPAARAPLLRAARGDGAQGHRAKRGGL